MLKKKTTKKTYFKDISSLPDKEYSDWIAVGPGIHKPDVVFVKLTMNWEIWEVVHQQAMEKSHEFKVKEGEAIVDFFKRS